MQSGHPGEHIIDAEVTGLMLAGGRAERMGGRDKGFLEIAGKPLLQHVLARLRPQVHRILISANGAPARFSGFCLPVVADAIEGHAGPLTGLHAGLQWARRETPQARYVASVPVDTPFLPDDLVARLKAALRAAGASCAIAASGGRSHPVVGLWDVALCEPAAEALAQGVRAMHRFAESQKSAVADFAFLEIGGAAIDPFFNVNTPADLETAEALLAQEREERIHD